MFWKKSLQKPTLPDSVATSSFHLANRIFIIIWQKFFLFICACVIATATPAFLLNWLFGQLSELYFGFYLLKLFLFTIITSFIVYLQYMTILELTMNIYHGQPDNWGRAFRQALAHLPKLFHPSTILIAILLSTLLAGADTAFGGPSYSNLALKIFFSQIGAYLSGPLGLLLLIICLLLILYLAVRLLLVFECLREPQTKNLWQALKKSWLLTRSVKNFGTVLKNLFYRYLVIFLFTLGGIILAEIILFIYLQFLSQIPNYILTFIFGAITICLIFVTLIYIVFFVLSFFPFSIAQSAMLYQKITHHYHPGKINKIPSVRPMILRTIILLSCFSLFITIALRLLNPNIISHDLPIIADLYKGQLFSEQLNIKIIDQKNNQVFEFQINGEQIKELDANSDLWQKIDFANREIYVWSANSNTQNQINNDFIIHLENGDISLLENTELFDKNIRQNFSDRLIDEIVRALQIVALGESNIEPIFFK